MINCSVYLNRHVFVMDGVCSLVYSCAMRIRYICLLQKKKYKTDSQHERMVFYATMRTVNVPLRKQAYSHILKNLPPKMKKTSDIFHTSAHNIDSGYSLESFRRGSSNEYPQSMFLSRKKKNNVYPCKPQFCNIKVGF